ncbi:MAG: tRNA epoxyqueuosine(34) reductase QueG [Elusimicrobiota bacterium]
MLSAELRERARSLGADLVGIAPAVLPPAAQEGQKAYHAWIESGMHGEMGYMAREPEKRADIRRWYPKARSVIVCAFSYYSAAAPSAASHGRLARYALPPDYHDGLKDRMGRLLAYFPELKGKVFVDASPVLERLYARYAGIGWVGKNTMLLSRRLGSFFLLAGLAVDQDLDYDPPGAEHCGTCRRCLDACPTGAFPEPRMLDASRCISYFTIEQRKRPVPEEFRAGHGDRLFGCDACQDACPWNKFAAAGAILKPGLAAALDLEELARSTPQEFNRRFKGTPLRRTGHTALVRNALLVMGNSGDRRFVPLLEEFTRHANPLLAGQARWSLAELAAAI